MRKRLVAVATLFVLIVGGVLLGCREHRAQARNLALARAVAANLPAGFAPGEPVWHYRVLHVYPHDPGAFTEGLLYYKGDLYESVGLRGRSQVRRVDLATGRVLASRSLRPNLFGEGLALIKGRLYQLTWKAGLALVWKRRGLVLQRQLMYDTQGWGMTVDGADLVMSDGSADLIWRDPKNFMEVRRVTVTARGKPVDQLNELEMVRGKLLANIWMTNYLARIDPATGKVLNWIDLSGLLSPQEAAHANVLNGIAYDPKGKRLFVTGKFWPKLFEIQLIPPSSGSRGSGSRGRAR